MVYSHAAPESRSQATRATKRDEKIFLMVFSAPLLPDGKVRQSRIHKYDATFERNWPSLPGSKTTTKPETRTDTSRILAADWKTYVYNAQALRAVAEEEAWNAQLLALQATSMLMSTAIECAYTHQ